MKTTDLLIFVFLTQLGTKIINFKEIFGLKKKNAFIIIYSVEDDNMVEVREIALNI